MKPAIVSKYDEVELQSDRIGKFEDSALSFRRFN
jgi:hypothetical protein